MVRYEGDSEETKELIDKLLNILKKLIGRKNVLCSTLLVGGDKESDHVESMMDCRFIIAIISTELMKAFRDDQSNTLTNIELRLTFAELKKNSKKVIPYYMGLSKEDIPSYLKICVPSPLNDQADFHSRVLELLSTIIIDDEDKKEKLISLKIEFDKRLKKLISLPQSQKDELLKRTKEEAAQIKQKKRDKFLEDTLKLFQTNDQSNTDVISLPPKIIQAQSKINQEQKEVKLATPSTQSLLLAKWAEKKNKQNLREADAAHACTNFLKTESQKEELPPALINKITEVNKQYQEIEILNNTFTIR